MDNLQNTEWDDYAQNPLITGMEQSNLRHSCLLSDKGVFAKIVVAKQYREIAPIAAWRVLVNQHVPIQALSTLPTLEAVRNAKVTLLLLGFNALYPNINNSPGLSFLSNGVGLTSPPLFTDNQCFSSCPPHLSFCKPQANTLASEEAILQTKTISQAKTPNFLAVIGHGLCRVQNLANKINLHANIPSPLTCIVAVFAKPHSNNRPIITRIAL